MKEAIYLQSSEPVRLNRPAICFGKVFVVEDYDEYFLKSNGRLYPKKDCTAAVLSLYQPVKIVCKNEKIFYLSDPLRIVHEVKKDLRFSHFVGLVLGDVSTEATWVKEGDKIDDRDLQQFNGIYEFDHGTDRTIFKVKGPCGCFH